MMRRYYYIRTVPTRIGPLHQVIRWSDENILYESHDHDIAAKWIATKHKWEDNELNG